MKTTLTLLAVAAFAGTAFAGTRVVESKTHVVPETECFRAHELSLDMFGQYSDGNAPDHAGTIRDHGWGGGIGINYFVTRNFGIGTDAAWLVAKEAPYAGTRGKTTIHNFSASLIYRFPIDRICTAPYIFAGGGVAVDGDQWAVAHAGVGIEHRIVPNKVGLFTDARFNYYGDRFGRGDLNNFAVRAGVRIVF